MLVVGAGPFQYQPAPSQKTYSPFVFGLHFGLHGANVLINQAFGKMGKGLQNLFSWVRFRQCSEFPSKSLELANNNTFDL